MRITVLSKVLLLLIVIGVGIGGYRFYQQHSPPAPGMGSGSSSGGAHPSAKVTGEQGLLGRPLRVGIVTWPGYAGGIVANNGFAANKDCIYWTKYNQTVEFLLMEDVDVRN